MILLTNDDGIKSPTLEKTLEALSEEDKVVVVPAKDVSGCSMCITIDREINVKKKKIRQNEILVCDGKTADCVLLGSTVANKPIKGVISGINTGPNLGLDVIYSGTVAGARKGSLLGIPSVAISMERSYQKKQKIFYESAYSLLPIVKNLLLSNPPPEKHFMNINIPNQPLQNIKSAVVTNLGRRGYKDKMTNKETKGSSLVFICEDEEVVQDFTPGTDSWAISEKLVSLTLLKDMINESVMDWDLSIWIKSINCFLEERNEKI